MARRPILATILLLGGVTVSGVKVVTNELYFDSPDCSATTNKAYTPAGLGEVCFDTSRYFGSASGWVQWDCDSGMLFTYANEDCDISVEPFPNMLDTCADTDAPNMKSRPMCEDYPINQVIKLTTGSACANGELADNENSEPILLVLDRCYTLSRSGSSGPSVILSNDADQIKITRFDDQFCTGAPTVDTTKTFGSCVDEIPEVTFQLQQYYENDSKDEVILVHLQEYVDSDDCTDGETVAPYGLGNVCLRNGEGAGSFILDCVANIKRTFSDSKCTQETDSGADPLQQCIPENESTSLKFTCLTHAKSDLVDMISYDGDCASSSSALPSGISTITHSVDFCYTYGSDAEEGYSMMLQRNDAGVSLQVYTESLFCEGEPAFTPQANFGSCLEGSAIGQVDGSFRIVRFGSTATLAPTRSLTSPPSPSTETIAPAVTTSTDKPKSSAEARLSGLSMTLLVSALSLLLTFAF